MLITKLKVTCVLVLIAGMLNGQSITQVTTPIIDGGWWQVAGDPYLNILTGHNQQPVDFAVWQAADGTWQLWSCIRHTKEEGQTRLFYRWEGENLTDSDWKPMGIAMRADLKYESLLGTLQSPHVIKEGGMYYMFYGDGNNICMMESQDGKNFRRVLNSEGKPFLFTGPYDNTRDPMTIKHDGVFYCYYCGHKKEADPAGVIFCRTSIDLFNWSEPMMVSGGGSPVGKARWFGGDTECPFVVEKDGLFYLFRNQMYGENNLNTQYCSPNPMAFGVKDDQYLIGTLPIAAPEIIYHEGEYYIATLLPSLKGIRIAKLEWVKKILK